jgi:hypothetical protein
VHVLYAASMLDRRPVAVDGWVRPKVSEGGRGLLQLARIWSAVTAEAEGLGQRL